MKRFSFPMVLLSLLVMGFVACSDDDNDKLSGIVDSVTVSVNGKTTGTIEYSYDEKGRIDKVIQDVVNYSREVFLFEYQDNSVVVRKYYTDEDTYDYTYMIEDGLATKYTVINKTEGYGGGYGTFTYAGKVLTGYDIDTQVHCEYTWVDGNIVTVKEGNLVKFEGEVTAFDNNASVDLNVIVAEIYDEYPLEMAAYAGVLGARCKNIVLPKDARWNIVARKGYVVEISGMVKEKWGNDGIGETVTLKMAINYK